MINLVLYAPVATLEQVRQMPEVYSAQGGLTGLPDGSSGRLILRAPADLLPTIAALGTVKELTSEADYWTSLQPQTPSPPADPVEGFALAS